MFTMPAEAWQALEEAPGQPPITEVRLPQAARPRHLTQAVRGLNRLAHLRRLSLPAPGGGGKVSLQELAHPAHQLTVSLDLPESGGCTIDRPPRLALRLARPLTMPATGKHAVRIVTPGEAPREPRRTLPDWPYLRDIGPRGVGQLLRLRLTREEAMRRGLQRLLRQALIQAIIDQVDHWQRHRRLAGNRRSAR